MRPFLPVLVCLLSSGCLGVAGDPAPTAAETGPSSGTLVETPIVESGVTWTVACVRLLPVLLRCEALLQGSALTEPLEFPGSPVALRAELEWASATPLTDELAIGAVAQVDGEWGAPIEGAYAVGTSPLRLDWDLSAAPGDAIGVHVIYYTSVGEPPGLVHFSVRQEWTLTGTLVSRVA